MHRIPHSILVGLALFFLLLPGGAHAYNPFDFSSDANDAVDSDLSNPKEVLESNDPAGGKRSSQDTPRRITLEEHFWGPDYRKRHINNDDARTVSSEEEDFYGPDAGFDAPQSRRSLEEQTLSTGLFHTVCDNVSSWSRGFVRRTPLRPRAMLWARRVSAKRRLHPALCSTKSLPEASTLAASRQAGRLHAGVTSTILPRRRNFCRARSSATTNTRRGCSAWSSLSPAAITTFN